MRSGLFLAALSALVHAILANNICSDNAECNVRCREGRYKVVRGPDNLPALGCVVGFNRDDLIIKTCSNTKYEFGKARTKRHCHDVGGVFCQRFECILTPAQEYLFDKVCNRFTGVPNTVQEQVWSEDALKRCQDGVTNGHTNMRQ
ncbi:hypothetical protein QQS21_006964 [Conoideocrella luteorostrata]|uniref:Uncharacterized protein n=1 Tax=Conoideocrella luteorostrata TaxID=1105319 RepID=A0AAJ0CP01_9HYPO|nr:hypothetical protein QQS21_006964 [Conoideocrella luteorostrata]